MPTTYIFILRSNWCMADLRRIGSICSHAELAAFVAHLTSFEKLLNYFSRTLVNMKNSSVYLHHLLTTSRALSHKPRPKGKQETEKNGNAS